MENTGNQLVKKIGFYYKKFLIMIKFCKSCLNPSTRPNIKFDKDGKCYVCVYESLKKLILNIKKTNGRNVAKK